MKVLMIGPGEPSTENSGLGVVAKNIAVKLSKKVELKVIHPVQSNALISNEITTENIEVSNEYFTDEQVTKEISSIDIASDIPHYFYDGVVSESSKSESVISEVRSILNAYTSKILEKTKKLSFDIIYAHDWTSIPAAMALKKALGIPLVLHIHSLDYDRATTLTNSWVYDLEKEGLEAADSIIAVSRYHAGIMAENYKIDPAKINVIHHAINIPASVNKKPVFKEKLVVFVGRLTGQKGPEQFLNIAKLVHIKNINTRFVIAGSGDLMQELIESGINASLEGKFHFTGQLTQEKLFELYSMADVYCMPSVSEPFGLTAIEAAAFKVPIVLSKQSGAAEVLPASLVADYWDTKGFAGHVIKLLEDNALSESIVEQNLTELKKHNWNNVADQIIEIFNKNN